MSDVDDLLKRLDEKGMDASRAAWDQSAALAVDAAATIRDLRAKLRATGTPVTVQSAGSAMMIHPQKG